MQAVSLYLFVGVGHQESHGRHPGSLQDGENPLQNRHLVDIFTKLLWPSDGWVLSCPMSKLHESRCTQILSLSRNYKYFISSFYRAFCKIFWWAIFFGRFFVQSFTRCFVKQLTILCIGTSRAGWLQLFLQHRHISSCQKIVACCVYLQQQKIYSSVVDVAKNICH